MLLDESRFMYERLFQFRRMMCFACPSAEYLPKYGYQAENLKGVVARPLAGPAQEPVAGFRHKSDTCWCRSGSSFLRGGIVWDVVACFCSYILVCMSIAVFSSLVGHHCLLLWLHCVFIISTTQGIYVHLCTNLLFACCRLVFSPAADGGYSACHQVASVGAQ